MINNCLTCVEPPKAFLSFQTKMIALFSVKAQVEKYQPCSTNKLNKWELHHLPGQNMGGHLAPNFFEIELQEMNILRISRSLTFWEDTYEDSTSLSFSGDITRCHYNSPKLKSLAFSDSAHSGDSNLKSMTFMSLLHQ